MDHPIILFDGVCNFCNGMVNFLIRQDKQGKLRFAALQSETGRKILEAQGLSANDLHSLVYIENGKLYKSSTATLRIYNQLPWYWKWTQLFWIIPPFLRNGLYGLLAKNRYRWFGKKEACMVPSPEVRGRFLD